MKREELARVLYETPRGGGDYRFDKLDAGMRRWWVDVAVRAHSALRGPRTGRELFAAFDAALAAEGLGSRSWEDIPPELQRGYERVAATFPPPLEPVAAPRPAVAFMLGDEVVTVICDHLHTAEAVAKRASRPDAPPAPEGWPKGFRLGRVVEVDEPGSIPGWRAEVMQRHGAATFCVAAVHGPFQRDTEERARLVAQAIASSRIVCGVSQPVAGGISRQIYEDLKRDHKALLEASTIQRREVDDLWKQIHDLKRDLLAANRMAEVDDGIHRCAVAERIGFAMPSDPAFVPGWQTIYDAVASAWSSLCCARQEAIPKLEKERDTLRARAESCHDALQAAKAEMCAARVALQENGIIDDDRSLAANIEALAADVNATAKEATDEATANLASHLDRPLRNLLHSALVRLVYARKITADEGIAALSSPTELAALLLRVRGPVGVAF